MPRTKKTKTPKSKTHKSKKTKSKKSKSSTLKEIPTPYQNIINVINSLSNVRNKNTFDKSRNNLPAQLISMNKKSLKKSIDPQVINRVFKSSSSFSSVTQNGETHTKGKKIINNSLKPFIEIKEMENGDMHHYMIPKTTIPYKEHKTKSKSTKRKARKSTKRKTKSKAKSTKRKTRKHFTQNVVGHCFF